MTSRTGEKYSACLAVQVWCPRPDVDVTDLECVEMSVEVRLKFGAIVGLITSYKPLL